MECYDEQLLRKNRALCKLMLTNSNEWINEYIYWSQNFIIFIGELSKMNNLMENDYFR